MQGGTPDTVTGGQVAALPGPVPPRSPPVSAAPPPLGPENPSSAAASPSRRLQTFAGWGALLLVAGMAAFLLYEQRPEGQVFYPRCSLHTATGLLCPGCGGLRATHELLHLRILDALRNNALVVLGPPGVLLWAWLRRRRGLSLAPGASAVAWGFAVLAIYTVVRNLPWSGARWLGP